MTQHFPLDYGNVVHQGFFDPIQELLGASLPSLRIEVASSGTALQIVAGTGNSQVAAALNSSDGTKSGYRWITSTINASLPGGLTNGTGSVYITASQNDFSGSTSAPDSPTTYTFAMQILASGTPSTDLWRKVGEVDVTSSSITAFRPMGGPRPTSEFGLAARPDTASQPGILVTGRSSQTGNLIEAKNSSGTIVYSLTNAGATSQSGGITTSSTDGITASGAGGKDTLNLSNTGSDTGITIGGDVELFRSAANTLTIDDNLVVRRSTSTDTTLSSRVTTDGNDRVQILAGGDIRLGPGGSTSPDLRVRRSGTSTLTIDTPSAGAANLTVTGNLTVENSLTFTQASTAGHVPISGGSGAISFGQIGASSIGSSAVETAKVADGAITTGKLADDAVTAAKLNLTPVTATGGGSPALSNAYAEATALTLTLSAGTYLIIGTYQLTLPDTSGVNVGSLQLRDGSTVLAEGSATETTGNDAVVNLTLIAVRTLASSGTVKTFFASPSMFSGLSEYSRVTALPIG